MPSFFLSNQKEEICVVEKDFSYEVYKVERMDKYGVSFYGRFNEFKLFSGSNKPISEQPYGLIGSCSDMTGRCTGSLPGGKRVLVSPGENSLIIEQPKYCLIGKHDKPELNNILQGYHLETKDLPYASISTSASAVAESGDDLSRKFADAH